MKLRLCSATAIGGLLMFSSALVQAVDDRFLVNYALQSKPLDTVYIPTETNKLSEAQFKSGLGLALRHQLFNIKFDYNLKGLVQRADSTDQGQLSQTLNATMRSKALNDLLAVNAAINADSVLFKGGDSYRYKVTPSFSRSIYNVANVNVKYNYALAKPSPVAFAKETKGYSLALKGSKGRLVWGGTYSESNISWDQLLRTESIEAIDFNSRYRLVSDLHLELSSTIKNSVKLNGARHQAFNEKHVGAGISWAPSDEYSFALKVNKVDGSRFSEEEYYGGGAVTWKPKHDFKLSLGYRDQLTDGAHGLILSTKLDLDKS